MEINGLAVNSLDKHFPVLHRQSQFLAGTNLEKQQHLSNPREERVLIRLGGKFLDLVQHFAQVRKFGIRISDPLSEHQGRHHVRGASSQQG